MESVFIFDRVEEILSDHDITQKEISQHTNLTQPSISRCLSDKTIGKAFFYIIQMLFDEHHLNPSWLFLRDNKKQSKYIAKKHR